MEQNVIQFLKSIKQKVVNSNQTLTEEERLQLNNIIAQVKAGIDNDQLTLMEIGRLADYNDLKQSGKTMQDIQNFSKQDDEVIKSAIQAYKAHIEADHAQMFGYPANMAKDSYTVAFLRWLESKMYFMNSCGDAYHPGNYRMNNSETEIKIIESFKKNLKLPQDKYWGYINSGGTEGNFWGIREGVSKYNNGIFYFADTAHYSVEKFAKMLGNTPYEIIPSNLFKIDANKLIERIKANYEEKKSPAILLLTCGNTTMGGMDDVVGIKQKLNELKIPHYIHLDAALYGGIPNNQERSPIKGLIEKLGDMELDSISISLHKYIGNTRVNGITLAKTQTNQNYIEYIGQRDVTLLGSRDFPAFSALQRITELYERTAPNEYYKNVKLFEGMLTGADIQFVKGDENGNTFVIAKPSEETCKKYQLATFNMDGKECCHIIIFPYHKVNDMKCLTNDIKKDYNMHSKKVVEANNQK